MADQAGQVAWMLRDSSWSRAEIEVWAGCEPLVDRDYARRGLCLGDGALEELLDALRVRTLLLVAPDSPEAPGRRRCTTTGSRPSWRPVPATASAVTSSPGTSGASTRSSPRSRGHSRPGRRRHSTTEALFLEEVSTVRV